jgi:hypothetical protein
MMPNKTIYVKDVDLPLFEQAQEQLGESVSSIFAEFLRDRVAKLTPEEGRIIELINQIARKREAVRKERGLPEFIEGEYAEAEANAEKSLLNLRAGDIRSAKTSYYIANAYLEWAEHDLKQARALGEKIATLQGSEGKLKKRPRK